MDTDTFTLLLYEQPHVVARRRARAAADTLAVSLITRAEVLKGRFESVLKAPDASGLVEAVRRLRNAEGVLSSFTVLDVNDATAARFDQIVRNKRLRRIGRADQLHASIAIAHDATLVTRNVKDYKDVPNLLIENWAD